MSQKKSKVSLKNLMIKSVILVCVILFTSKGNKGLENLPIDPTTDIEDKGVEDLPID